VTACGSDANDTDSGTVTGNPLTIQSLAYEPMPEAGAAVLSDFRTCVTQIQLTGVESAVEDRLGLVDLSNHEVATVWGTIELEDSLQLEKLVVQLAKDADTCEGADYSIRYRNVALEKDLEFVFEFSPAVTVTAGDTLSLGMDNIAVALEDAWEQDKLNDEDIGEFVERFVEEGRVD
jgi:hypothetical protein